MSGLPELPTRLAVVCHDAGACNVILPWLAHAAHSGLHLRAVMHGPAERLRRARFGAVPLCSGPDQALHGAQLLISGTSWATSLEHDARVRAAVLGVRSAAVLDHWVNYPDRFVRHGLLQWPDEFWVADDNALALARQHFPAPRLRCLDNLYLAEQVQAVPPLCARHREQQQALLYVMEPMRNDWGRGVAGEWQALDWFMQQRVAAGIPAALPIRLRPHPSDEPGKYAHWLALHPEVQLGTSATSAQALSAARWVVGCESYALVVALAAGRVVFCSLPPWAAPCRLPHTGLRSLGAAPVALA
ncbi:MAG: hypothetical protein JHC40_16385 [Burkholderiales bacterium]|jgi:hypothetical protein|nr:hypothetical protein [Burkholderiales bacterium]